MNKKIYFIYMPSQTLGRYPMQGVNGAGIFGGFLKLYSEDDYIQKLQKYFTANNFKWDIFRDDTESDIEELIKKNVDLLVCAPGLKYQFNKNGFNKDNIVYLTTMEFSNCNIRPVLNKIKEFEYEQRS